MPTKRIFVLGATGGVGRMLCRYVLQWTPCTVALGGRSVSELEVLRDALHTDFPDRNITVTRADAMDYALLVSAFEGSDLVIDATTAVGAVETVVKAALEVNADYLDFHFDQTVVSRMHALEADVRKRGRCCITQAGFHPGLPATFIRSAASHFDTYTSAYIGMVMNQKIEKFESLYELVDLLDDYNVELYKNGSWQKATYRDIRTFDFGERFGTRVCYPLQMEEVRAMPELLGLKNTGVYVAGFNWFVDYFVIPLAIILLKIHKNFFRTFVARVMHWAMNTFAGDQSGVSFVLDAEGEKDEKIVSYHLRAEHTDAYVFTAVPVVACVRQYLDGTIARPGVHLMGHVVDPMRIIADMKDMGIVLFENTKNISCAK